MSHIKTAQHTTNSELLTVDEAAEMLRTTPYTLRRLLRGGKVQGTKIGRQWRVNREALRLRAGLNSGRGDSHAREYT